MLGRYKKAANAISDEIKLDLCDNPHTWSRQASTTISFSHTSIVNILEENKMHLYKMCRYWSTENPCWMRQEHTQYPQNVNIWAGIVGNHINGPFFNERNLNGDHYLPQLQNDVIPTLANLYPDPGSPQLPGNTIWFQQEGAPPNITNLMSGNTSIQYLSIAG